MQGADLLASEWKYIPARRTALFLQESLYRGTQWVVFEPNDEPLWAQIRLNIGAFMNNLFRQGAFQGTTPQEAYFVKCDKETTTQTDINLGIVNILVGFAPLKPAERVGSLRGGARPPTRPIGRGGSSGSPGMSKHELEDAVTEMFTQHGPPPESVVCTAVLPAEVGAPLCVVQLDGGGGDFERHGDQG